MRASVGGGREKHGRQGGRGRALRMLASVRRGECVWGICGTWGLDMNAHTLPHKHKQIHTSIYPVYTNDVHKRLMASNMTAVKARALPTASQKSWTRFQW
eukprot:147532-Chlamydomonas_euryale.AAC.1